MKKHSVLGGALGALAIAGLTARGVVTAAQGNQAVAKVLPGDSRGIVENSQKLTVFAIGGQSDPKSSHTFRGYGVKHKSQVTGKQQKAQLVSALLQGIADPKAQPAKCFDPHHGVRAERDGKVVDLLICFECDTLRIFPPQGRISTAAISDLPKALLDQVLRHGSK